MYFVYTSENTSCHGTKIGVDIKELVVLEFQIAPLWLLNPYFILAYKMCISRGERMIVTMTGEANESFWNMLALPNKHLFFLNS